MRKASLLSILTTVLLVAGQLALAQPFGMFDGH
jgi:hypothetical protein